MTFPNRNVAIHFHMKIDIKAEPHFANEALVDSRHALHRARRFPNTIDNFAARRGIENFIKCGAKESEADAADDKANENRSPIVRAAPLFAADERD